MFLDRFGDEQQEQGRGGAAQHGKEAAQERMQAERAQQRTNSNCPFSAHE